MTNINDLKFLPLDLPYVTCDAEKIKNFMDLNSTRINYSWTEKVQQPWNHVIVRSPKFKDNTAQIPGSGWREDFKIEFPEVVNAVERLPYLKILYVYLFEQCIEVAPHFDHLGKNLNVDLEPASYRINLLMEDQQAFYICNDIECSSFTHPQFPLYTNTWVFSNKETMHGSIMPENGKRKILLIIGSGVLDESLHLELLKKSFIKYQNFIL
jgi:hypothetical protein